MAAIPPRTSQAEAPGAPTSTWTAEVGNQPFHVEAAVYNAGADELQVTVGLGRVDWGAGVVTEYTAPQQGVLDSPAASTTYHVHLTQAGIEIVDSAVASAASVRLAEVDTGADRTVVEIRDVRGMISPPVDMDEVKKWALIL